MEVIKNEVNVTGLVFSEEQPCEQEREDAKEVLRSDNS